MKIRYLFTSALLLLLPAAASHAHLEKRLDLNGGHYDDFGQYHCHERGCRQAPDRYSRHRGLLTRNDVRDMERYFLEEDWPTWELLGGGCQDARNVVLSLTSREPVTYATPRECTVRMGRWIDEYTGEEYTRAPELEIDHIISPLYAFSTTGYQWDLNAKRAFANDPLNLIPVSRDTHRKKRGRSISDWRPREEFLCEYAQSWQAVAEKYELELLANDRSRINGILEECGPMENIEAGEREEPRFRGGVRVIPY